MKTWIRLGYSVAIAIVVTLGGLAQGQELSGKGSWQSLSSESIKGSWTTALTQKDAQLEGSFDLQGSNVFSGGAVDGEITASKIAFGLMVQGARWAEFTGKVDGDQISGEWTCEAIGDHGVWYGTLKRVD